MALPDPAEWTDADRVIFWWGVSCLLDEDRYDEAWELLRATVKVTPEMPESVWKARSVGMGVWPLFKDLFPARTFSRIANWRRLKAGIKPINPFCNL